MSEYRSPVPPGWPKQVQRPGAPSSGWETSAAKWLFDQAPGAWRDGLNGRQYPDRPLLARDVRYLIDGQINGLRAAYRRARVELAEKEFQPEQIDEQLAMYREEAARLEALLRQVQVVEDALTGVRWVPRSRDVDFTTLD